MADPDSSIKSIFSGRVSPNESDDEFSSQNIKQNKLPASASVSASGRSEHMLPLGDYDSLNSQSFRYTPHSEGNLARNELFTTSTNASVASSCSDYQHPFLNDTDAFSLGTNQAILSESFSRPASRNSTTSCLSTTATKDGVEGKKIHRHGPSPYFSNVINNMVHQQQQQQGVSVQPVPQRVASLQGSQEVPRPRKADIDAVAQPPVTIQEKIVLMNTSK